MRGITVTYRDNFRLVAFLSIGLGLAGGLAGQVEVIPDFGHNLQEMTPKMEARFRERYESAQAALEDADWKLAFREANRLVEGLRDSVTDSSPGWAARALILRAIANAAMGNNRDALWDYDVAVAFVPQIDQMELPDFPPATQLLKTSLATREPCRKAPDLVVDATLVERKIAPYPSGMEARRVAGFVIIEPCVDSDGFTMEPRAIKAAPVPFMLTAFEAVGVWRYEPAMSEGRRVPHLVEQTVDFLPLYLVQ